MNKANRNIIDKIKKCLRLSSSSNEHEAASALRQAQKLMNEYGLTEEDIVASEISESIAKSGAKASPISWETYMANKIGSAFGCRVIFKRRFDAGHWSFVGSGAKPEVAQYAFAVLLRQARKARSAYINEKLKRCKRATKTKRADLFCHGWVISAAGVLHAFIGPADQAKAIESYMDRHYPSLITEKTRDRNVNKTLREHELNDFGAGHRSGKEAELNRGVSGSQQNSIGVSA